MFLNGHCRQGRATASREEAVGGELLFSISAEISGLAMAGVTIEACMLKASAVRPALAHGSAVAAADAPR